MPTPKSKTATKSAKSSAAKKGHATPEYGLQAVDELPPEPKRGGGGNAQKYQKLLEQVMETPGQMFQIAQFRTRATAKRVVKRVDEGEMDVPGDVGDWQIIARNVEGGSALFAQYK